MQWFPSEQKTVQGVGAVRGRGRKAIKHDADSHACSRMKLGERG